MRAPESGDRIRERRLGAFAADGPARDCGPAAVQPPRHQGCADRGGQGDPHEPATGQVDADWALPRGGGWRRWADRVRYTPLVAGPCRVVRVPPRMGAAVDTGLVRRELTGGCLGRLVAGCARVCVPDCPGREQQDPPGVDEVGIGEGTSAGLWPPAVERVDLVPAFAVAEAAGGDIPQIVTLHHPVHLAM